MSDNRRLFWVRYSKDYFGSDTPKVILCPIPEDYLGHDTPKIILGSDTMKVILYLMKYSEIWNRLNTRAILPFVVMCKSPLFYIKRL